MLPHPAAPQEVPSEIQNGKKGVDFYFQKTAGLGAERRQRKSPGLACVRPWALNLERPNPKGNAGNNQRVILMREEFGEPSQ